MLGLENNPRLFVLNNGTLAHLLYGLARDESGADYLQIDSSLMSQ